MYLCLVFVCDYGQTFLNSQRLTGDNTKYLIELQINFLKIVNNPKKAFITVFTIIHYRTYTDLGANYAEVVMNYHSSADKHISVMTSRHVTRRHVT